MEVSEFFNELATNLMIWIGFGTLAGLLAKAIMPGRDPGGALATVIVGIAGTIVGGGTLLFFAPELRISPVSPVGFVVATGGAFILLLLYRVLAGRIFREGETRRGFYRSRRPRAHVSIINED